MADERRFGGIARLYGETEMHRIWIESLLVDYYDSMYTYQLDKKRDRIVFSGEKNEVFDFLKNHYDIHQVRM